MNAGKDAISDPCEIFNDSSVAQAWNLAGTGFCIINLFSKSERWCSVWSSEHSNHPGIYQSSCDCL